MSNTKQPAFETPYPPMTPTEAATSLGVPLTQKQQPDFYSAVPNRLVTLAEAKARGWAWYWDGASTCRYSHKGARRAANGRICSDCQRVKDGLEPIYPKSRAQKFYELQPKDATAAAAPIAPSIQEPTRKEQKFLESFARTGSFTTAAEEAGFSQGEVEARLASNETFRKAHDALCERANLPRSGAAPTVAAFQWSPAIEAKLIKQFIDTGLLQVAREMCGIAASDYWTHLEASPTFAAAIEAARPKARETLRDRAVQSADRGNPNLMKLLEEDEPDSISNMSIEQMNAEIMKLLPRFLFSNGMRHKPTGQLINFRDLEYETDSAADSDNSDLVS